MTTTTNQFAEPQMFEVWRLAFFAVQGTKGCCPLFAFGHSASLFPSGILPHLLQLPDGCAKGGIVQLTGELKLAHNGTHLSIVHSNRQFNNKTLKGHRH